MYLFDIKCCPLSLLEWQGVMLQRSTSFFYFWPRPSVFIKLPATNNKQPKQPSLSTCKIQKRPILQDAHQWRARFVFAAYWSARRRRGSRRINSPDMTVICLRLAGVRCWCHRTRPPIELSAHNWSRMGGSPCTYKKKQPRDERGSKVTRARPGWEEGLGRRKRSVCTGSVTTLRTLLPLT